MNMDLYIRAKNLVEDGKKTSAVKQRVCMKCRKSFSSKGDRTCEVCTTKNQRFGTKMNNQYSFGVE
jgi:hypothetical protein